MALADEVSPIVAKSRKATNVFMAINFMFAQITGSTNLRKITEIVGKEITKSMPFISAGGYAVRGEGPKNRLRRAELRDNGKYLPSFATGWRDQYYEYDDL